MKCPYRDFQECLVQECPSCNYETETETVIEGRAPHYMDTDTAIEKGYQWESKRTKYKFVSCSLVSNNVQPVPKAETHIHNETETNVAVSHSIF